MRGLLDGMASFHQISASSFIITPLTPWQEIRESKGCILVSADLKTNLELQLQQMFVALV